MGIHPFVPVSNGRFSADDPFRGGVAGGGVCTGAPVFPVVSRTGAGAPSALDWPLVKGGSICLRPALPPWGACNGLGPLPAEPPEAGEAATGAPDKGELSRVGSFGMSADWRVCE